MTKHNLKDVTFTIPVRLKNESREKSLNVILNFLFDNFDTNIILYESDIVSKLKSSKIIPQSLVEKCRYIIEFVGQDDPFHRTKYLNDMAKVSQTPIVVNYDGDLVCEPNLLVECRNAIINERCDFTWPYSGDVWYMRDGIETEFLNSGYDFGVFRREDVEQTSDASKGGIVFSNRESYWSMGMENERFVGWGYEDDDRMHRIITLGFKIKRLDGRLYHFYHPRDKDSSFDNPYLQNNLSERERVLGMKTPEQLINYIQTWEWLY